LEGKKIKHLNLFCDRAAFEREIDGLPTTRSVGDLPPELRCPLCKEVMKDAVLTSKCCFRSFCDKCKLCFKKQLFLQTAVIDTDVIQYKCLYLMDFLHCIFLVLFVLTSRF
jgi:prepilin signal peptidase PulO-like enzyme (type II secretory pathway)